MPRYLPLAIIGAVFLLAVGGGVMLLKWKQQHQPSPTSPLVPVVEATPEASELPRTETPEPLETPGTTVEVGATAEATVAPTPAPETHAVTMSTPEPIHIRGKSKAAVTLEEYGDFQCQPCGRLYPVLKTAEEQYGDRLRVVFRHMPLHKHEHALLAARAAEAAGLQGRFWEMHDMLFENSLRWTKGIDSVGPNAPPSRRLESNILAMDIEVRDVFFHYAELLHLDVDRFKQDLDSDAIRARVESDRARGAGLGIDRTPTVYVNGHHVPSTSSITLEGLHAAIDAALAGKVLEEKPASPSPAATRAGAK